MPNRSTVEEKEPVNDEAEKWRITSDAHCHMLMLADDILRPLAPDAGAHIDDVAEAVAARVQALEQDHAQYADEAEAFEVRIDELETALKRLTGDEAVESLTQLLYLQKCDFEGLVPAHWSRVIPSAKAAYRKYATEILDALTQKDTL